MICLFLGGEKHGEWIDVGGARELTVVQVPIPVNDPDRYFTIRTYKAERFVTRLKPHGYPPDTIYVLVGYKLTDEDVMYHYYHHQSKQFGKQ